MLKQKSNLFDSHDKAWLFKKIMDIFENKIYFFAIWNMLDFGPKFGWKKHWISSSFPL